MLCLNLKFTRAHLVYLDYKGSLNVQKMYMFKAGKLRQIWRTVFKKADSNDSIFVDNYLTMF